MRHLHAKLSHDTNYKYAAFKGGTVNQIFRFSFLMSSYKMFCKIQWRSDLL